ncbi:hypothetical protein [Maricaulis sp.]|uniref:hypothetical protein n=1 Tax=unclassified Maricaulis TaxID=2632371 RepID=UPI001B2BBCB1|nr:hypothetical protein [Maricaulis sp.]MBO6798408.1 hypothetical protein [Maricaulis sp.]
MFRTILIAAALVAAPTTAATAQSCEAEPQFAFNRTSNALVRAQFNSLRRAQWERAIHFGTEVSESGASPRDKVVALSNLCYAYAASGDAAEAIVACDAAIEQSSDAWRALNNRGAANWLAGNRSAAAADFQAAAAVAGGEDEVQANMALAQCS